MENKTPTKVDTNVETQEKAKEFEYLELIKNPNSDKSKIAVYGPLSEVFRQALQITYGYNPKTIEARSNIVKPDEDSRPIKGERPENTKNREGVMSISQAGLIHNLENVQDEKPVGVAPSIISKIEAQELLTGSSHIYAIDEKDLENHEDEIEKMSEQLQDSFTLAVNTPSYLTPMENPKLAVLESLVSKNKGVFIRVNIT